MGKAFLTLRELRQFPTIEKLMRGSDGEDTSLWGMCVNVDGEISFGKSTPEWKLVKTVSSIFAETALHFGGKFSPDDLLFFYGTDLENDAIIFTLIPLSEYEESSKETPQFTWDYLQE